MLCVTRWKNTGLNNLAWDLAKLECDIHRGNDGTVMIDKVSMVFVF
jgi:hypothetical protein